MWSGNKNSWSIKYVCRWFRPCTLQLYSSLFRRLSERRLYSSQQVHVSPGLQYKEPALQHLRTSLSAGLSPWRLHSAECLHLSYRSVVACLIVEYVTKYCFAPRIVTYGFQEDCVSEIKDYLRVLTADSFYLSVRRIASFSWPRISIND